MGVVLYLYPLRIRTVSTHITGESADFIAVAEPHHLAKIFPLVRNIRRHMDGCQD